MKEPGHLTLAIILALIAPLLEGAVNQVMAGAWSQPAGHYYTKLSGIFYSADEVYNERGVRQAQGMDDDSFDGSQGFLYVEYGLRERLTVVSQVNAGVLAAMDTFTKRETTGIGDVDLGVKYQLTDGPVVLSPFATLKIPTGYNEHFDPPMGTGHADLELRLLAARSLYPLPVYVGAESGFRFRGGEYSNQLPYFLEVGVTPHPRVFAKGYVSGINTRTSDEESTGEVGSLQVSEGDFTKLGFNGAYKLAGPMWVDVLVESIIDGENVGAGVSWGLGFSYSP